MGPSGKLPSNILAKEFYEKRRYLARSPSQLLENHRPALWISVDGQEFFSFPDSREGQNSGLRKFGGGVRKKVTSEELTQQTRLRGTVSSVQSASNTG